MPLHPSRPRIAGAAAAVAIAAGVAVTAGAGSGGDRPATAGPPRPAATASRGATRPEVIRLKDARLKFEINATDRDGGVQVFIDADGWRRMSLLDPAGRRILDTVTSGRMARQGGTELFLESAEPSFGDLPLRRLLKRFPEGRYAVRGTGRAGERYVGTARLSHAIPAGPVLVSPLSGSPPQDPDRTTVVWKRVAPPKGGRIIGYQVLVVRADAGPAALPKIALDVIMPPTATRLRVPRGFLRPATEYEWEVLAIEQGGNQTLSSDAFTTTR